MSFDVFDVAASGMNAQRVRMDTISSNIANINTTRNPDGSVGPYIKKQVSFKAIYDEKMSQGASNFSNNSTSATFNPATGTLKINSGVSMNYGQMSSGVAIDGIVEGKNAVKTVYDPSHPDANADGYVTLPNINVVEEMVGMVEASRAYEANSVAAENVKNMISAAMKI
ncbi:MAG TPA: flagellar basal body rod protein FlgC [Candidatus Gastranaerophilaceae bacterium]|nr:flagellar basal body rod protein FlgC [Candidatus Gastranaerophilaceae bacterium]HPT41339.1 flagellar basal body rod protein FlgC [Candidatus Gastranaerophilaceae bacterium]